VLKRVLWALAALAFVFVGVLFVVSRDIDPPDDAHLRFEEGPLPTEGNGFPMIEDAIALVVWPGEDDWTGALPIDELPKDEIPALVELNRPALERFEDAIVAPEFRAPIDEDGQPKFLASYPLCQLAVLDASVRMGRGDQEGAFQQTLRCLELGHRLQRTGDMLFYQMGVVHKSNALASIVALSAASDREGLDVLARRVREHGWERDAMEKTLRREYAFYAGFVEAFQSDGWLALPVLGEYFFQPNRSRRALVEGFTEAMAALDVPCSVEPPEPPEASFWNFLGPNAVGKVIPTLAVRSLPKFASTRCVEQMNTGVARIVLALRAYRADEGVLPESLDVLVPDYLETLSMDLDGEPFRYSPTDGVVYSVGYDRIDDGGQGLSGEIDWSAADPGVSLVLP
jgi:hypothetical protein